MILALAVASVLNVGAGATSVARAALDLDLAARSVGKIIERLADRAAAGQLQARIGDSDQSDDESDPDGDADADADLEIEPPQPIPPVPAVPGVPPAPRVPHGFRVHIEHHGEPGDDLPVLAETERELPRFTESAKNVPTVEVLHRLARAAGWSITLVGVAKERIDVDVKDADPREALRQVLQRSGSMGVLRQGRLVVISSPEGSQAGTLIEQSGRHGKRAKKSKSSGNDLVRVFQGDLVVPAGTLVQGDVVNIGGSIEVEPGSVVQGDAVSVLGSLTVDKGGVVLGDGVAVVGGVEIERGAQVMGEHVQVGMSKIFGGRSRSHGNFLTSLGPFGLFPTIALFAIFYLLGLVALRMWPERVRAVGGELFGSPVRSFFVGFLCWLLVLPGALLLLVSVVGIPLIPLLPLAIFLSITLGLSSLALRVGESLPAGPGQRFVPPAALGMGVVVLLLLACVPWLGVSMLALLQFFALGAAVSSRFGRALPPHA